MKGKILVIGETKEYGEKKFRKRELVIDTFEEYSQSISIEFLQDNTDMIDRFKIGDCVDVSFNIRGRKWTNQQGEGKYFNSLIAYKIVLIDG